MQLFLKSRELIDLRRMLAGSDGVAVSDMDLRGGWRPSSALEWVGTTRGVGKRERPVAYPLLGSPIENMRDGAAP